MRFLFINAFTLVFPALCMGMEGQKQSSSFYPPAVIARLRTNVAKDPWAKAMRDDIVAAAAPWLKYSDEQLWQMMFGPRITRSWMVWSNGYCPICRRPVPMYTWLIDPAKHPWKVQCPHCRALFPTNDFKRYHDSGLDHHGLFQPTHADRSLLYNADHPDPRDPLHSFGVDDGEGFVQQGHRWRFIGTYLIYGQWKRVVLNAIRSLAAAYVVSGDARYAHKAGILLDRVADLYPSFDFITQAMVYERKDADGYVSTWHDACVETRELALAYDQIFDAISKDSSLVRFLHDEAQGHGLANSKSTFADIQRNIEQGILEDPIQHPAKIHTNYPGTQVTVAIARTVQNWPGNKSLVYGILDKTIDKATAIDGLSGEKGSYSASAPVALAGIFGLYDPIDPQFLPNAIARHPKLRQTFRFHIDTICCGIYYPHVGDGGEFAKPEGGYHAVPFQPAGFSPLKRTRARPNPGLTPSTYHLFWRLYQITGDPVYAQEMYLMNNRKIDGLPYDLMAEHPDVVRDGVAEVIERKGPVPSVGSVNKAEWHLAILRSGEPDHCRALWLNYESGPSSFHGNREGLDMGLFAHGLDLMPDLGYPPVQYGGWGTPRVAWYRSTAAHNTVVVDDKDQAETPLGHTTLFWTGKTVQAVIAECPQMYGIKRYSRTVVMLDVGLNNFYVVDVFRVAGGHVHTMFFHSAAGTVGTDGLNLSRTWNFGPDTQLRHFKWDQAPQSGWSAEWTLRDSYHVLPAGKTVKLRYTDLTGGAKAGLGEGWVSPGGFNKTDNLWIPWLAVRREGPDGLESTFVSVIEAYDGQRAVRAIRRIGDALEVETIDGKDLIAWGKAPATRTDSQLAIVRWDRDGKLVQREGK